jgi:hypothetical protein
MPGRMKIELTEQQRRELEDVRDHSRLPYLRERAAAILKISDGLSGRQTARYGLLKPHWQDTVYDWVHRYQEENLAGLKIRSGRGRKPGFSPRVFQRRDGS